MTPRRIIIHHSATVDSGTVSWNAIRRYHMGLGWGDVGYHCAVELVTDAAGFTFPEILIGRAPDVAGAHTKGHNHDSLGVCVVGNYDAAPPPDAVWDRAVCLVAWLCRHYSIQPDHVHGHRDFARKSCPGVLFDMHLFRGDVRGQLA